MSQYQNARAMDEVSAMAGSIRRARERAEAGLPRGSPPNQDPYRRPQAPPGFQSRNGQAGVAISRPSPVPQWPLAGPVPSPASSDSEPYKPPPGRSQPPKRPPRPSRVPSILDGSKIQDHTPVFQYTPTSTRASELSAPETANTLSSRPSTLSSVGSIPDFPLPVAAPPAVPRRSVNLGPPPSARRGASSFYSTASFVSPIPEESPKTRSHTSYASSAAIPESFGSVTPGDYSPNEAYFDDTIAEESIISEDADESRLVRSASIGKRGKPSLVTTRSSEKTDSVPRPTLRPVQGGPFEDGTGFLDASSSSTGPSSTRAPTKSTLTADNMLSAFEGASATDPSSIRKATPSPKPFRLSGLRRPPRLDMDAVRAAEARGSLTSLPDLIRRATRLAALMDRGRRPASRFDELDFPEEAYGRDLEKYASYDQEKYQSGGLSDMLAAFPPPGSRRSMRQSSGSGSWPLAAARRSFRGSPMVTERTVNSRQQEKKEGRRCCGLPLWGFLFLLLIIVSIVAVAVVVPLEIFVVKKSSDAATTQPAESDCANSCANGGTSVITQGVCSCICSNGFTGSNCTVATTQGCTTTTIENGSTNINNVTIGQAIPRLMADSEANFSIPLDATTVMSKFSSSNLSCNTENALVTFDGQSMRTQGALSEVTDFSGNPAVVQDGASADIAPITLTVDPSQDATIIVNEPTGTESIMVSTLTTPTTLSGISTIFATTLTLTMPDESTSSATETATATTTTDSTSKASTTSSTTAAPEPTASFTVTQQVLDFARIAVLYVLQEETFEDASTAQTDLQKFFTDADSYTMTMNQAMNLTIGGNNTVDLVNFFVNIGSEKVGGGPGG
ncbi:hypothetical protein F5Y15DRAFT_161122 [Xylariaceae sp. FL0016]|nr:hypothetical protein F5Y15DRAFT_161122 [Xylariaceae sp. FL0016]